MNIQGKPRIRARAPVLRSIDVGHEDSEVVAGEGYILKKRVAYGQEAESEERIRVPDLPAAHGRVTVDGSLTKNLGDYNSCRVGVTVSLPCLPEVSEVERTYGIASKMVEGFMDNELKNILSEEQIPG